MGDTTTSTIALWDQLAAAPRPDLCRTFGTHDARDGICRDCGKTLAVDDPVASTCRLEDLPGRGVSSPAPVGFWRRWSA